MTAEELLRPRFEVIAEYPKMFNQVGDILIMPNFDNEFTIEKGLAISYNDIE